MIYIRIANRVQMGPMKLTDDENTRSNTKLAEVPYYFKCRRIQWSQWYEGH